MIDFLGQVQYSLVAEAAGFAHLKHTMQRNEVLAKHGLDSQGLALAQNLAAEVLRVDGVALKIDWETAAVGVPDIASSFCCYDDGTLAGYGFLEGSGGSLEVTAAVAPAFRRRGIFKALLQAATDEARRRGATELLGIGYRSASGTAAVQALGLPFVFSEYRMETALAEMPVLDAGQIQLQRVDVAEVEVLVRMTAQIFGKQEPLEKFLVRLAEPASRYFFAGAEGTRVGQIGVVDKGDGIYIRGVGILPEHRQRGLGQQLLAAVLTLLRAEGQIRFALDVATENPAALSIYKACGFQETTVYDYYAVSLAARA